MTEIEKTLAPYLNRTQIKQHTPEWDEIRKKIVSATKVSGILEVSPYGPKNNEPIQDSLPVIHGNLHEDAARKALEKRLGNRPIYELGLALHKTHKWLGASPDGITVLEDGTVALIELKCPYYRQITRKIPFDYWVQMQIQMEVWDVNVVIYSENEFSKEPNVHGDPTKPAIGRVLSYWDIRVDRDSKWLETILPILRQNKQRLTNERIEFWSKSFNMYQIRNWVTGDPLMDWLDRYHNLDPQLYKKDPPKKYDLTRFTSKQTRLFHGLILSHLQQRDYIVFNVAKEWFTKFQPTDPKWLETVSEPTILKSFGKWSLTMQAIQQGYPVIADAILINEETQRWGKADLLVREDILPMLFNLKGIETGAIRLRPYSKYYIVLTRFASLKLTADGVHLLNEPKQKLYKSYISFLTDCLPRTHRLTEGYIIGRKATWTTCSVKNRVDGFSKSIGRVSLTERDSKTQKIVEEALSWLEELNKDGTDWRPDGETEFLIRNKKQLGKRQHENDNEEQDEDTGNDDDDDDHEDSTRKYLKPLELCPNMKNKNDHPWHATKKRIAQQTHEITEVLNIGSEKRNKMIQKGITNWKDITYKTLEEYKIASKDSVINILKANQQGKIIGMENVAMSLRTADKIRAFLDFETVTDLNESIGSELIDTSPGIGGQSNIIYMIGCYISNENDPSKSVYCNYLVDEIDPENEQKILSDWIRDVKKVMVENKVSSIPFYHWSPAEVIQLRRAKKAYGGTIGKFIDRAILIDLYAIFKDNNVGIPGAVGYGLKTVAKALHSLGKIEHTWEENLNGADAMVAAWYLKDRHVYPSGHKVEPEQLEEDKKFVGSDEERKAKENLTHTKEISIDRLAKEIIKYNYYDCKVMEEIVEWATKLH